MSITNETRAKVDSYVKENSEYNQETFNTVKNTIPAEQQAEAERVAKSDLKA